ncbi:MAG: cytochrome c maturation protein CcmE [Candidatus Eisenbacteria bacterium]|nr:cytochrome c maturation protein CcmE [Candidatus Eisenbacteria bacterium]
MAVGKGVRLGVGIAVILAASLYLGITGFREGKAYYHTVEEMEREGNALAGTRIKVGGRVEPGSLGWAGSGLRFRLAQDGRAIPVLYTGDAPVPDTFGEGSEAVIEGTLREDGLFEARRIQTKCASKYEAAYGRSGTGGS